MPPLLNAGEDFMSSPVMVLTFANEVPVCSSTCSPAIASAFRWAISTPSFLPEQVADGEFGGDLRDGRGIAKYVGKSIAKHIGNRLPEDKGARLVRYTILRRAFLRSAHAYR
jgi:hypothetical protein